MFNIYVNSVIDLHSLICNMKFFKVNFQKNLLYKIRNHFRVVIHSIDAAFTARRPLNIFATNAKH